MQVHEVARDLGVRPIDLIERVDAAGYPGLTPSTELSPPQVDWVRSVIGMGAVLPDRSVFRAPAVPASVGTFADQPPWAAAGATGPAGGPKPPSRTVVVVAIVVTVALVAVVSFLIGANVSRSEDRDQGDRAPTTVVATEFVPSTAVRVGPSFGVRDGRPAPIADVERFCDADIEFTFSLQEVFNEIEARNPGAQRDYHDALAGWFSGRSQFPTGAVRDLVASFGAFPLSDEAATLQQIGVVVRAQAGREADEVGALVREWSDRFADALVAIDEEYTAWC